MYFCVAFFTLQCSSDEHNCALTGHRTFKTESGRHKALVTDNDGVYDDVKLTPADLLTFAWQIAKGMVGKDNRNNRTLGTFL